MYIFSNNRRITARYISWRLFSQHFRCTLNSAPDCLGGVDKAKHYLFLKEKIEVEKLTSTQDALKFNFNRGNY